MLKVTDDQPKPVGYGWLMLGGLPDLATAVACLLSWWWPALLGVAWVKIMALTVLVEFLVIHAGAFLAVFGNAPRTRLGRSVTHLALASFYGLFIWAIARDYEAYWLYPLFAWLLLSKLLVCWSSQPHQHPNLREQLIDWPFAVASYLIALLIGIALFENVRGGIDYRVFREAGLSGKDLFDNKPWAALAAGSIYFTAMGIWRMRVWRWARGRAPATR